MANEVDIEVLWADLIEKIESEMKLIEELIGMLPKENVIDINTLQARHDKLQRILDEHKAR